MWNLGFIGLETSTLVFLNDDGTTSRRADLLTFIDARNRRWECKRMPDGSVLPFRVYRAQYGDRVYLWSLDPDCMVEEGEFEFC